MEELDNFPTDINISRVNESQKINQSDTSLLQDSTLLSSQFNQEESEEIEQIQE